MTPEQDERAKTESEKLFISAVQKSLADFYDWLKKDLVRGGHIKEARQQKNPEVELEKKES